MTIQHSKLVYTQGGVSVSGPKAASIMQLSSTCVADSVSRAQRGGIHTTQIYAYDLKSFGKLRHGA